VEHRNPGSCAKIQVLCGSLGLLSLRALRKLTCLGSVNFWNSAPTRRACFTESRRCLPEPPLLHRSVLVQPLIAGHGNRGRQKAGCSTCLLQSVAGSRSRLRFRLQGLFRGGVEGQGNGHRLARRCGVGLRLGKRLHFTSPVGRSLRRKKGV